MTTKPTVYLDACCFIDAVKLKVGAVMEDGRENHAWFVKRILDAHKAGDLRAFTSFLSIAECLAVEKAQADVPAVVQAHFRDLLTSGQYVILSPPTPRTGQIAQDLRWKHGARLSGADGLHLATAIERGASEFITSDEKLKSQKNIDAVAKLPAGSPKLITAPQTLVLPAQYRQDELGGTKD